MKTTAYLRVSTDAQDADSQRAIIAEWQVKHSRHVDHWISDTASGAVPWQERQIAAILNVANEGDCIVVSEISRIARSIVGVLTFLEAAAMRGIEVVAIRSGIVLDSSLASKVTVTVLALAAEIERDLIRERTRAALAAKRARGEALGRKVGQVVALKLDGRKEEIVRCLAAKVSKRAIARMLSVSPTTLHAWLDRQVAGDSDTMTRDAFEEVGL